MHNNQSKISGTTRLTGIIGWPLSHVLSPAMVNATYQERGLDYCHVPLRVNPDQKNSLQHAILGLKGLGFVGANVTIPYKEAVIPFVDVLSPTAKEAKSVNTILVQPDGCLFGDTTDGPGFIADLRDHGINDFCDMNVEVVGAGGSARAIIYSLLESGCKSITIYNRTVKNAEQIAEEFLGRFSGIKANCSYPWIPVSAGMTFGATNLIVNCTAPNVISKFPMSPHQTIYDLNYMEMATNFRDMARNAGAKFISGKGMLNHAIALSLEMFVGDGQGYG